MNLKRAFLAMFILLILILSHFTPSFAQQGPRSLLDCINLALTNNIRLDNAKLKVQETEFTQKSTRGRFLPALSLEGKYLWLDEGNEFALPLSDLINAATGSAGQTAIQSPVTLKVSEDYNYQSTVAVKQGLTALIPVYYKYQIDERSREAADLTLEETRQSLILMVTEAYYNVIKAQKYAEVTHQTVLQLEAHQHDANAFYEADIISKTDVLEVELKLAEARQMAIQADNGIVKAISYLNYLMNEPVDAPIEIIAEFPQAEFDLSLEDCQAIALENRPDLRISKAQVDISELARKITYSELIPMVALVGSYQRNEGSMMMDEEIWSVGIAGTWNVFEWGATAYEARAAGMRIKQAMGGERLLTESIQLEVINAFLSLNEAKKRISVAEAAVARADENLRQTREKFLNNLATSTQMLDAQSMQTQAKINQITSISDFHISGAKLEKAMGKLGSDRDYPATEKQN